MRVLITGANGQLGRTILQQANNHLAFEFIGLNKSHLDITDEANLQFALSEINPDIVLNLAAYTNVEQAEAEPEVAYRINDHAVGNLAMFCKMKNIPFIHLSTDFVFNEPNKIHAFTEQDQTNPINAYGKSKLAGENKIISVNGKYIILRTSWLISNKPTKNFYRSIYSLISSKDEVKVVADQYGAPTVAENLAEVIISMIKKINAGFDQWGIYHYCDQPQATWYDLAKAITDAYNKELGKNVVVNPILAKDYPTKAKRPYCSLLSCEKIMKVFGIQQKDWLNKVREYIPNSSANTLANDL